MFKKDHSIKVNFLGKGRAFLNTGINTHIGKEGNTKFCLHNTADRNGECLAKLSLKKRVVCITIIYPYKKGRENYEFTPVQIILKYMLIYMKNLVDEESVEL